MKIAFATIGDTRDIKRGSGTPYHLWRELLRQGHTVHLVGPLQIKTPLLTRFFKWLSTHIGKRYLSYRDPFMGRALGKAAGFALDGLDVDFDFILTNDYCIAGYTQTRKPIVLYTDAFFPRNYTKNTHPWLAGLSIFSVFFSQYTTVRGLKQAVICAFASQFAADEARKYPQTREKPMAVIPYGANIPAPAQPSARSIENIRAKGRVDVLFIGKDWELKGGEIAVKTVQLLNQRGTPAHLHIAGVGLSAQYPHEYLTFYGLLNKDCEEERKTLEKLFQECDVLLVPSKAEGYGLVFVEAAAYGMPCLAYEAGGVTTSLGKERGGALLPLSKDESDFANKIEEWLLIPGTYERLAKVMRESYIEEKNWSIAVSRLINIVKFTLEKE